MSSLKYLPPTHSSSSSVLSDLEILPFMMCELETNISYPGSGTLNLLGGSPQWVKQNDDTESFNQTTKTYTCPLDGSYEIAMVVMPDSGFTLQISVIVRITNPDGSPFREYPLEYSRDAYHRGGYVATPKVKKGSTIQLLLSIPTSGTPVFRGQTTGTGYTRTHTWFSIKYDPKYRVGAGSLY